MPNRNLLTLILLILTAAPFARAQDFTQVIISVPEQKLFIFRGPEKVATYKVSTSKFGIGDEFRSYRTPLGVFRISSKVGNNLPLGAVLKGLRPTGEVLKPNAPGRDPIVSRVLCLDGLEKENSHARSRGIYIHGTPQEKQIGRPASYGCIRMKSRDVIALFDSVPVGTLVRIEDQRLGSRLIAANSTDTGGNWFQ